MPRKRICFVTGTRAEFGLMRSVLAAIRRHPKLKLQILVTGMHLDRSRGRTISDIGRIDAVVPWRKSSTPADLAVAAGRAAGDIASGLKRLKSDVVLVVGDRVEAFAAASAGAIGGRVVAHVHGGDRALGQVDDSLRHAITKLSHIHFPATRASGRRIVRLGEEPHRIHTVGSPGIDDILQTAARNSPLPPRSYALLVLHPIEANDRAEQSRAAGVLSAVLAAGIPRVIILYPNTDPGSAGIIGAYDLASADARLIIHRHLPRPEFLAALRDAAMLVGNTSAGIIEAASFGTPVIDIGPRQLGRQRSLSVKWVDYDPRAIQRGAEKIWRCGRPRRDRHPNPYAATGSAGRRIAHILGRLQITPTLLRKLITY